MDTKTKIKRAGQIGSWYFLLLGCLNLGIGICYSRTNWFDVVTFGLSVLPILIRTKRFYMVYGIIGCFFGVMGLTVLLATLQSGVGKDFWMGSLLILSFLSAALLLTYAGMASENDNRFDLI
jgi:hypothetical protein